MGIRSPTRRSSLADANERRDWRIFAEFAHRLIAQARKLYAGEHLGPNPSNTVYAFDLLLFEPGAVYVMECGCLDFERLFALHEAGAFFVTRSKSNADLRRLCPASNAQAREIVCGQTVALMGFYSREYYPRKLRRIRFKDSESRKNLAFMINLFGPSPLTVCKLYKARRF